MPTYNPNDFYPQTDAEVKSDGNVAYRENAGGALLPSAARTSGATSSTQTNYNARGVQLYLNVTQASGTGGLQVQIYGVDPVSGTSVLLNAMPTAITAVGKYAYELYPGISGASGSGSPYVVQRTSGILPRQWFVYVGAVDGTSYTYSLGYSTIL